MGDGTQTGRINWDGIDWDNYAHEVLAFARMDLRKTIDTAERFEHANRLRGTRTDKLSATLKKQAVTRLQQVEAAIAFLTARDEPAAGATT